MVEDIPDPSTLVGFFIEFLVTFYNNCMYKIPCILCQIMNVKNFYTLCHYLKNINLYIFN